MATITQRPLISHLQASSTTYIQRMKAGKVVNAGAGETFWFRSRVSSISELPLDERELPLLFRDRTSDYQKITVQASITYRFVNPEMAVERIDFTIDNVQGNWVATPLEQIGGLLNELAQQHAASVLAEMRLSEVIAQGVSRVREAIATGLRGDDRIGQTGIDIVDVRVVAIRPESDMEKALQTPIREALQQQADKATFERRALAVEQERGISENELHNRIELAKQEESLVKQQGINQQKRVEDEARSSKIETESEADNIELRGRAKAAVAQQLGAVEAENERSKVEAYAEASEAVLLTLAVKDVATNLPNVGTLVISPEMLTPLLAKFAGHSETGSV